ncbi:hypothetical protein BD413DRAFT_136123 [Trametes elegans]|nr:hypothetical protein BD413DRAFT_136123 [Trametes elegans]
MCGSDKTEIFVLFYTKYLYSGTSRPKLPPFAHMPAWTSSPRLRPLSSRLSRLREGVPHSARASDATTLAQLIYEARAELSFDDTSRPCAMDLYSGGSILAIAGARGWKERDSVLRYYWLDNVSDEWPKGMSMDPRLSNVVSHITTDEERKLVLAADEDRIKSFSWNHGKRLLNVHTMNSLRDFHGPLVFLPKGASRELAWAKLPSGTSTRSRRSDGDEREVDVDADGWEKEEAKEDIDEEYSAGKCWPDRCYHKENFFSPMELQAGAECVPAAANSGCRRFVLDASTSLPTQEVCRLILRVFIRTTLQYCERLSTSKPTRACHCSNLRDS